MKTYTRYRVGLWIGLFILNILSSCAHTGQKIFGIDSSRNENNQSIDGKPFVKDSLSPPSNGGLCILFEENRGPDSLPSKNKDNSNSSKLSNGSLRSCCLVAGNVFLVCTVGGISFLQGRLPTIATTLNQ